MKVFVVTILEYVSGYGTEADPMVFSSREKAEAWIEHEIDSYVNELGLDPDSAVDGWDVELVGNKRTIHYAIDERVVQ